jgi:hypothetical protein
MPIIASACGAVFSDGMKLFFITLLGHLCLVMASHLSVLSVARLCSVGCWDDA